LSSPTPPKVKWRECVDRKSKRIYFSNSNGETTWTRPIELARNPEERRLINQREESAKKCFREMESNIRRKFISGEQYIREVQGDIEGSLFARKTEEPRRVSTVADNPKRLTRKIKNLDILNNLVEPELSGRKTKEKDATKNVDTTAAAIHRSNSSGTLYIDTTMVQQNDHATISCVCAVILMHILDERGSTEIDKSNLSIFEDTTQYHRVAIAPTLEDVIFFFQIIFERSQMVKEGIIMTLIYFEKLLTSTDLQIKPSNWRAVLFTTMLVSSKVSDDISMWNIDFSKIIPSYNLSRVNDLERTMLEVLRYDVVISASDYARYYFNLRSMMMILGLQRSEVSNVKPLDKSKAIVLDLTTLKFDTFLTLKKASSFIGQSESADKCDGPSHMITLEQLTNTMHLDADGSKHVSKSSSTWLCSPSFNISTLLASDAVSSSARRRAARFSFAD
jgi:hypothetical protein